jgi:pyridoxamine 5'-phosphate oxidase
MSSRLESLEAIEAALWRELQGAPRDKQHPWRSPVLATTDGEVGDARTVILREVNAEQRTLLIYTDARAGKVTQVTAHPLGTLVMWSPALGWQLRLRIHLQTTTEGLELSSRWARLALSPAANDYLSSQAPGDALDNALAARGERAFFALLEARVLSIDWLELHAQGHRRARFSNSAPACWLQP